MATNTGTNKDGHEISLNAPIKTATDKKTININHRE